MLADRVRIASSQDKDVVGQQEFTTPGTYNFVVPAGVKSICAVCVGGGASGEKQASSLYPPIPPRGGGGGALAYVNDIPVVPGEVLVVTVGSGGSGNISLAPGGASTIKRGDTILVGANGGNGNLGGTIIVGQGCPGRDGGTGSYYEDSDIGERIYLAGGGGGAGGYTTTTYAGNGGRAGSYYSGGRIYTTGGGSGGGVGIYGTLVGTKGTDGRDGWINGGTETRQPTSGTGSYGGSSPEKPDYNSPVTGGTYGGGGGGGSMMVGSSGSYTWNNGGSGGGGAVRIIWGKGRAFPSTRTLDE